MSHDERVVRELIETWMKATMEGDAVTLLSLMTDDVLFLTPGREPFGKAAFAAAQEAQIGMRVEGAADVREVSVEGDIAYATSRLTVTATPAGGKAVRRSGHTLSVFRRGEDGRWRLARDANLLQVEP